MKYIVFDLEFSTEEITFETDEGEVAEISDITFKRR